jgi:hypothetical protein
MSDAMPSPKTESLLHRWTRRATAAGLFVVLAACAVAPSPASEGSGRAGLIVGLPDGSFASACVTFAGGEISGQDLLRESGFAVTMDEGNALGTLVCSIAGEGCAFPDQPCLCHCRGAGPCSYWAYFNRTDEGAWAYAVQGARLHRLRDGDLDAWIWIDRSLAPEDVPTPPENLTFENVCG